MLDEARLEKVRHRGGKTIARCPACGEVGQDKAGKHLFIQSSGAYGCVKYPGADGSEHRKRIFALAGARDESKPGKFPTLDEAISFMEQKLAKRITRRDPYHDAHNNVQAIVGRFDGSGEKEFRPFHPEGASDWAIGDPPGEWPVFHLPKILEPDLNPSAEPIFIPEGEKCVCAVESLGLKATTSAHGAKAAHRTDWRPLAGVGRVIVILPDNDSDGERYAQNVASLLFRLSPQPIVKVLKLPGLTEEGDDIVDWLAARNGEPPEKLTAELLELAKKAEPLGAADVKPEIRLIEFKSPLELKNFVPLPGTVLVGDNHITLGSVFVEGGTPGVGKSLGLTALGIAGATQSEWFGYKVHRRFKTMIVQTENGLFRLWKEFSDLDCEAIEDYVRICPPPPCGLCFKRKDFCKQLADEIAEFQPDIVGFDPWNAAAREQDSREYLDTFDALKSVLPTGDNAPALGIVAHTRKPKSDERTSGRALLNLLAGSYVLGSIPRTVFIMQAASDDVTDDRVVWTCCKNNDGELGARSAWHRRNGLFVPAEFFDWQTFDHPPKEKRGLQPEILREFLEKGKRYKASQVASIIMKETGRAKPTAFDLMRTAKRRAILRHYKKTKDYELF
jgi:hypothetical protein